MLRTLLVAALLASVAMPAAAEPAALAPAVADTEHRTPKNVALDEGRKPAELLSFLGLEKGMRVLDLFGLNLYWAEIIAPAVGPDGFVVTWAPNQFYNDKGAAAFADFHGRQPNTLLIHSPFEAPRVGSGYDFILLNLDYHDVYWTSEKYKIARMEPDAWVKAVYDAASPGAVVGVVDHVGPTGDTRAIVDKLHRIDPATVRADFERAGFVFDGQSELYANPADDHGKNVFDEAIRGKTDRFVFRFKKPR